MPRALTQFLVIGALLVTLGAPVFVMSWRRGRRDTTRNFAIGAGVVALFCGVLAGVSETQVAQCQAAGNTDCIDAGAAGLQLVMVGIYLVVAWMTARFMRNR